MTMVESVLQVYTNIRGSRILLCAPSNSAADLLVGSQLPGLMLVNCLACLVITITHYYVMTLYVKLFVKYLSTLLMHFT